MSRAHRRAARVDEAQGPIVDALRTIPGVSVVLGMDDILVGYRDRGGIPRTLWYEIKSDPKISHTRKPRPGQKKIAEGFRGHYRIVSTLDEILRELEIVLERTTKANDAPRIASDVPANTTGRGREISRKEGAIPGQIVCGGRRSG